MNDSTKMQIVIEGVDNTSSMFKNLNANLNDVYDLMNKMSNTSEKTLNAITNGISKISNVSNKASKSTASFTKSYAKMDMSMKKLAKTFVNSSEDYNAYIENMNLFQVSMKENADSAFMFASGIAEAFGMDVSQIVRFQGVFANLTESMGNTRQSAYDVSKALVTIGYDLASLWNRDIEQTMYALQSGLVGQTKPLRNFGIDTTYATLQQYSLGMGIQTTVKQMSQADKQLLRTIAILDQSKNAWGDMANTIESPANQMKVLKDQLSLLSRGFGAFATAFIGKFLPYLNAGLMIIFQLMASLAKLVGIKMPNFNEGRQFAQMGADIDESADSAKKLKKQLGLLPFDEITNISTKTNTDTGFNVGSQYGGLFTDEINKQMNEYYKLLEKVDMKATTIRDTVMEWLGFSKELDKNTGETYFSFEKITGGTIIAGIVTLASAFTAIATVTGILKKLGMADLFMKIGGVFTTSFSGIGTVFTSISTALSTMALPLIGIIAGIIAVGIAIADLWKNSADFRKGFFEAINNIKGAFSSLWKDVLVPFGSLLKDILTPVFQVLKTVILTLYEYALKPLVDLIATVFMKVIGSLAEIFSKVLAPSIKFIIELLTFLWKYIFEPIVSYMIEVLSPMFIDTFKSIGGVINGIKNILSGVIDFITGVFTVDWRKAFKGLANIAIGLLNTVIDAINLMTTLMLSPFNALIKGWNNTIGKVAGKIPEIKISIPKIPRLADGGIITQPMYYNGAFTGENYRKEAIIPLQNSGVVQDFSMMISANITDAISGMLEQPIVNNFYVDGEKVVNSVNKRNKMINNQFGTI